MFSLLINKYTFATFETLNVSFEHKCDGFYPTFKIKSKIFYYMENYLTNINNRLLHWIDYSIQSKHYNSEADFIKKLELATARTKLSDIKRKKANFTLNDVVIILTHHSELNPSWVIKGDGEMLLAEEKMPEHELINELKRVKNNYDDMKKERDEWFYKARKYEEELNKHESLAKTNEAI